MCASAGAATACRPTCCARHCRMSLTTVCNRGTGTKHMRCCSGHRTALEACQTGLPAGVCRGTEGSASVAYPKSRTRCMAGRSRWRLGQTQTRLCATPNTGECVACRDNAAHTLIHTQMRKVVDPRQCANGERDKYRNPDLDGLSPRMLCGARRGGGGG